MSFSLPIDIAMRVADELRATGKVTRRHIGARTQPLTPELAPAFGLDAALGALVVRIDAGSPAEIQERVCSASRGALLALRVWRHRAPVTVQVGVVESVPDISPKLVARSKIREVRFGLDLAERKGVRGIGLLDPGLYVQGATGSAQRAGLRYGDALIAVNDVRVAGLADFDAAIQSIPESETVALLVMRGSTRNYIPILPRVPKRASSTQ